MMTGDRMSMNYHFSGEDGIASPQLVYYRDIIEENIDRMIAIAGGVERVHILDGRIPHSILIELLSDEGIGTMLKRED